MGPMRQTKTGPQGPVEAVHGVRDQSLSLSDELLEDELSELLEEELLELLDDELLELLEEELLELLEDEFEFELLEEFDELFEFEFDELLEFEFDPRRSFLEAVPFCFFALKKTCSTCSASWKVSCEGNVTRKVAACARAGTSAVVMTTVAVASFWKSFIWLSLDLRPSGLGCYV